MNRFLAILLTGAFALGLEVWSARASQVADLPDATEEASLRSDDAEGREDLLDHDGACSTAYLTTSATSVDCCSGTWLSIGCEQPALAPSLLALQGLQFSAP